MPIPTPITSVPPSGKIGPRTQKTFSTLLHSNRLNTKKVLAPASNDSTRYCGGRAIIIIIICRPVVPSFKAPSVSQYFMNFCD